MPETGESEKPKRFWLFAFNSYYPSGGMGDFFAWFDHLGEAITISRTLSHDSREVVDIESGEVVFSE